MSKKTLLSEEEMKEIELFDTMSYDELVEYLENKPLNESATNECQELDMTYEEFISTYDAVDFGEFLGSFGVKI